MKTILNAIHVVSRLLLYVMLWGAIAFGVMIILQLLIIGWVHSSAAKGAIVAALSSIIVIFGVLPDEIFYEKEED